MQTVTSDTSGSQPQWPTSIVVLGHSGAIGYNSDPTNRNSDAPQNSWATGDNPAVNSIYLRALARNPAVEGHNFNVARSGSTVDDLPRQVQLALAEVPLPDLFIIQSIDNDIRCDGTDADNYEPYGHKIDAVLASIVAGARTARIYVVGVWATVQNYTDVTQKFPAAVGANQGGGPCDVFDQSGQELPSAMAYYQDVIDHYQANLKFGCDLVPSCQYGGDEIGNMALAGDDLAPDFNHLSIQGQAKMAETAWTALNS